MSKIGGYRNGIKDYDDNRCGDYGSKACKVREQWNGPGALGKRICAYCNDVFRQSLFLRRYIWKRF